MSRFLSRTHWILLSIVAVAAFLRLYRLDVLPPGFQFDQAFYVFDVLRLLQGQLYIFFAAPGGSEPLYLYLAMAGVALFGDTSLGLKLTSALIGILTVPLIYGFARTVFRSARIGLLAAFLAAISLWHIFFTRYGERVTLLVLLEILIFWFLWRALLPASANARRDKRMRYFALTGVVTAMGLYTYVGSRVVPFALAVLIAYAIWNDRAHARDLVKGTVVTFLLIAALCLPLGVYFALHPDQFFSHSAEVSIFVPHGNVPVSVPEALLSNAVKIGGMFFIAGDTGNLRNVPGRPIFDPLVGTLFVIGVVLMLVALFSRRSTELERRRALFLATWISVALAISLFTDDAPNFVRTLPAMPAIMILPAWGASALWDRLRSLSLSRSPLAELGLSSVAMAVLGVVVGFGVWSTYRDYFIVLANDPATYYTFDTDKVETAGWINQNAKAQHLFLAPLWAQNGTISLLTRTAPLKSFETRDTIVLPDNRSAQDALFGFPFEQANKALTMATRLGTLGSIEHLTGSNGGGLLVIYRVPAENLPDSQDPVAILARGGPFVQPAQLSHANWAGQFELLGSTTSPEGPGGRNVTVSLFLHALAPATAEYTFSIKVRDSQKGRVWGQEDKWPGDNSYATTMWSPGDLIVEKFYPGLNACAPAGNYAVSVEAYDPKTMQVLAVDGQESSVALAGFQAGPSESNRLEDLEPETVAETKIDDQLQLLGYTLSANELHAGDDFSLALYWRGKPKPGAEPVTVRLKTAEAKEYVLGQTQVSPPTEGRGVCTLLDMRAPPNVQDGPASLWVNDTRLVPVNVIK